MFSKVPRRGWCCRQAAKSPCMLSTSHLAGGILAQLWIASSSRGTIKEVSRFFKQYAGMEHPGEKLSLMPLAGPREQWEIGCACAFPGLEPLLCENLPGDREKAHLR